MERGYFHLIVDEVSDKFGNGYLGISVRFFDQTCEPITKFYKLIKLSNDSTGKELHRLLEEHILFSSRRKNNLISLITDGASSMAAEYKGLASRVANKVDHLFWLHCTSHCLNLILENACNNVVRDIVSIVKEISSTFSFSNINHAELQIIQDNMEREEKKFSGLFRQGG